MIHESQVTFHNHQYFDFTRKQDSTNYKLEKQHELFIMVDRNYVTLLADNQNPLCKIKTRIIDFSLSRDQRPKENAKSLTIYFTPPVDSDGKKQPIKLATIKSSKAAIQQLRQAIDKHSKYKSCLAFVPSRVTHISILSGESPTQRFRGFINLAGVMFLVLNLRNILDNLQKYGIKFQQTPLEYVPIHFIIVTIITSIFPLTAFFTQKLKFKRILPLVLARIILILNMFAIVIFNVLYCSLFKPYPILAITCTSVAVVLILKLISYYQVNDQLFSIKQRLFKNPPKLQRMASVEVFTHYEISQQNLDHIIQNQDQEIKFKDLCYFLVIPTLCYQLTYPKTSSIRWMWLAKRIFQAIFVLGLLLILWYQYIQPELNELMKEMERPQISPFQLFNRHLRLSIPNTMAWIAGFYLVFHLGLNISGEILYFGDRNFYRDWWNCRSIQEYWKTWNLPVHFWFLRHVYNPFLQLGFSKTFASLTVFFISAVAHEYIVSVALGFLSFWAFLAMIMQAPVIVIQKKVDKLLRIQNSELSNVSFWVNFCIIGQPIVVFIYYAMYTEFINNSSSTPLSSGFIPIQIPIQIPVTLQL